jgi:hypothetical protein
MTTFSDLESSETLPPAEAIAIPVEAFAQKWQGRPDGPVPVGIRLVGESENDWARKEAAKEATKAHGGHPNVVWIEAYNAALARLRLVVALCDPEDARKEWAWWRGVGQGVVGSMFTADGIDWLYTELERVERQHSPASAQASDDDIQALFSLAPDALERMPPGRAARIRRVFAFLLEEVRLTE